MKKKISEENNWVLKLKQIFNNEQINEEDSDDESNIDNQSGDYSSQSLNSKHRNANDEYDNSDYSSLDLDGKNSNMENNRMIYQKVANAFLEEEEQYDSDDCYFKTEFQQKQDKRIQKHISKKNIKEFEIDYILSKLNVDINPALDVIEMSVFDRIALFQAHTIFEKAYKKIWFIKETISQIAYNIVNHNIFTFISLVVISFNSVMLAQDDPTTNTDNNADIDLALLIIYTIEMGLKILAYGFMFGKNAYIYDSWNIVDLVIIVTGYLPFVLNSNSVNLSALRSLRVLRPLRSVSKVKSLNQLLTALFSAIPLLKDVLIILGFFFAIFGIAGLQLFTGQLKTRCYDSLTGIYMGDEGSNLFICATDTDCPNADGIDYICAKGMISPNHDFYNFDTFGWSILNVYIIVSNEGWSQIMYYIQVGFSYYTLFYFIFTIYIGTFFLMNLTMAIIGVKYSEALKNQSEQSDKAKTQDGYNMQNLIRWGIYKSNKILYQEIDERKKMKKSLFDFSFSMGSYLQTFKNKSKQKQNQKASNQLQDIQEIAQALKKNKVFPLMGGAQETNEDDMSPKILTEPIPILEFQNKDQIIEDSDKNLIQNADNQVLQNTTEQKTQLNSNKVDLNILLAENKLLVSSQNSKSPISAPNIIPIKIVGAFSKQKSLKQRNPTPIKSSIFLRKSEEKINCQQEKEDSKDNDLLNNDSKIENSQEIKNNLLIDPSILTNKLEIINRDQKIHKGRSKRLTYVKKTTVKQDQKHYKENNQNVLYIGERKINFAPIQKQKSRNNDQRQVSNINLSKVSDGNEGQLSDRRKQQKNSIDVRRTSKRLMNFQFLENQSSQIDSDRDEHHKLDDEEFLHQIEQQEKNKRDSLKTMNLDHIIENQYLKSQNNNFILSNFKSSQQNSPSSTKYQSGEQYSKTERPSISQDKGEQKLQGQTSISNNVQHNRRQSFNQQKRNLYQSNNNISKASRGSFQNNLSDLVKKSAQNSIGNHRNSIAEESLSQVSDISFINSPLDKMENSKPMSRKDIFSNLYNELEVKLSYNQPINSLHLLQQEQNILKGKILNRNQTISQQEKSHDEISDAESSQLDLEQEKKMENQMSQKINKQIDQKADEFKLLLDSKYLKPRVLYEQANDYTDEIQPHKRQAKLDEMKRQQQNKLKKIKFIIKQNTNVVINKQKQNYFRTNLKLPYKKSMRVTNIQDDFIFQNMLESKNEQQIIQEYQQYKNKGDLFKNEVSSIGSPSTFKQNKFLNSGKLNNKSLKSKDDDKNATSIQHKSGSSSPNLNKKQNGILKLSKAQSSFDQVKDNEDEVEQSDNQFQKNSQTDGNLINQENIAKNQMQLEASLKCPSQASKSMNDIEKAQSLKNDTYSKKGSEKQLDDIQLVKNDSADITEQPILSKRQSTKNGPSLNNIKSNYFGKDDHSDQSSVMKSTTIKLDRKQQVSQVASVKKGKSNKGDELEFNWNIEKAFNKIFLEEQNQENEMNIEDNSLKHVRENMMQQIEQRIIKKTERQFEILNRQESTNYQSAIKSNKSFDTAISLSSHNIDDLEKEQSQLKIVEVEHEVFDIHKFASKSIDQEFIQIRKKEIHNIEKKGNNQINVTTSADDVLKTALKFKSQKAIDLMVNSLNYDKNITEQNEGGFYGLFLAFRRRVKGFVLHPTFDNMIMLCVVMNTVILCLDGLVTNQDSLNTLSQFNFSFTIIFAIDMALKLIGQGFFEYVSDKMNIFDAFIVILSIFELVFLGGSGSSVSAFRSIRILRVFRVLRMTRLLRSLQFMKLMITAITSTLEQFIYILLLLFLFMFIYSLLGMSVFGGNFPSQSSSIPSRLNFDSFLNSAFAVLDVLTLENWNDLLTTCLMAQSVDNSICSLYLISWIFIGNYVFMNLVLAVIMDSFDSAEVQKDKQEIENRFEVIPDLDLNHASMGTTFMNNLSNITGLQSFNSKQKGLSTSFTRINTVSNKTLVNKQKQSKDQVQNESMTFEKSKSVIFTDGDDDESGDDNSMKVKSNQQKGSGNKKKVKEFIYFEGIDCEKALFLFSKEGCFRRKVYEMYKHSMFEKVILIAIVLTSIKLTIDTYIPDSNEEAQAISFYIDEFFTAFFICEALFKIISLGFCLEDGSYLRDYWSQLDFFIILSSIIDLSLSSIDLSAIKILRLLRTLRPLRLLSQNKSMKLIVTALLESVGGIANMIIVVILIWLMFAILSMNLMKGKLNYCDFGSSDVNYDIYSYHQTQCEQLPNATWKTYDVNSDNIGTSMLMLFILSTFEGWPNYVWNYIDGSDSGPVQNNSTYFAVFFFVFIFIGSFFSINLFTAIIAFNFDIASKKSKNEFLTDEQSQWVELQKLIINSTPDFTSIKAPENRFRKILWKLVESPYLEIFVMICIIGNIITMAMSYDTAGVEYNTILANINLGFTSVFITESICKIIAYGVQGFFYKGWNQFDFFVVCSSIVDIVMTYSGKQVLSFLRVGPQIARVLRVLRVSRLLKLIKSFQGLQKLVQTTIFAFPKLLNATALLCLFYFLFAVLACFLFQNITDGKRIDNFNNFSTFHRSVIMLFRCSTGEDWYIVMFDAAKHQGFISIAFFISFYTVQSYILMNLFVLIIINEFEENYINPDNPLQNFNEQEDNFKSIWVKMTFKENGIKIHEKFLSNFYFDLPKPLGFDFENSKKEFIENLKAHDKEIKQEDINIKLEKYRVRQKQEAEKQIMKMNIFCDNDGFVYFNELLFYFFKFSLYETVYEFDEKNKSQDKIQKHQTALDILKKEEKVSLKKIAIIKKKQSNLLKSKIVQQRHQGVNPMVRRLFVGMTFKSWNSYSKKIQDNINQINFNRDDISSKSDTDSSDDEKDDEKDNFHLEKSFEDGIDFKKNNIIKRQHTVAFRKNGFQKYREEHQKQEQISKSKKYYNIPNTDIYKNDFYDCSQNKYCNSQTSDNQTESFESITQIKHKSPMNIINSPTPHKSREQFFSSKVEQDRKAAGISSSSSSSLSSIEQSKTDQNEEIIKNKINQTNIPKLVIEKVNSKN